jgi:hypothetical protein
MAAMIAQNAIALAVKRKPCATGWKILNLISAKARAASEQGGCDLELR